MTNWFRWSFLPFIAIAVNSSLADQPQLFIKLEQGLLVQARSLDSSDVVYLALDDLVSALKLHAVANDSVHKFEVRLPAHRIKVTAQNSFLVITEVATNAATVYQLPQSVIHKDSAYYVPVQPFVQLFGRLWPAGASFDSSSMTISIGNVSKVTPFDIAGVDIEQRLNGYLLTVHGNDKLKEFESWLKPDGWLFITVPDATTDTVAFQQTKPYGAIRKILVFQSPTSVQLTFRVAPDVVKADPLYDVESGTLLISLHTISEAEKAELERKRQLIAKESLEKERERWKLDVIVIDAGHGGQDPGTIGVTGVREKDVTLGIALKLGKLIQQNLKGVKVTYTRKSDNFVELYRRAQIANDVEGKLFVSIHCNSTERKPTSVNGFEIYLLRPGKTENAIKIAERENSAVKLEEGYEQRYKELTEENFILVTMRQSAYAKYSERFAEKAAESMAKHLKKKKSGVKQAGFYVLVGASMPNVLVETGYLSNRKEEKLLKSAQGQKKIAEALFSGIKGYKVDYEKALQEGATSESR